MWSWANQPPLPSSSDVIDIKEEISVLESKMEEEWRVIETAQRRLAELTKKWEERKAHIAPIRRVNFDVLSSIFELCGQIDSRAPLQIGRVSRYWRAVVLSTPRAWCFLDVAHSNKPCREAYIERSCNQDLHFNLTYRDEMAFITPVAHRIRCMALPGAAYRSNPVSAVIFRRLTCLLFRDASSGFLNPSWITASYFPNLCHLDLGCLLVRADSCSELPPLQSLTIIVRDEDGWPAVMKACNTSLKSLKITIEASFEQWILEDINYIHLPQLLYLQIIDQAETRTPWWHQWDAPVLETFIEHFGNRFGDRWSEGHEYTTSHMRLARAPSLSNPIKARFLQLDMKFQDFCPFLDMLRENVSNCPQLEHLEFGHSHMSESEMAEAKNMIHTWDRGGLSNLTHGPTMNDSWSVVLPGENEMQCGCGMPCVSWASR